MFTRILCGLAFEPASLLAVFVVDTDETVLTTDDK
jgi:hypothetical protein